MGKWQHAILSVLRKRSCVVLRTHFPWLSRSENTALRLAAQTLHKAGKIDRAVVWVKERLVVMVSVSGYRFSDGRSLADCAARRVNGYYEGSIQDTASRDGVSVSTARRRLAKER
jgi:hypothetical protein